MVAHSGEPGQHWWLSDRYDTRALPLADRHYNRQKIGSPQFVPPGRCVVLLTADADALWVTSWPFAEYVKHAWAGAWVNSLFRNESPHLSSELITTAVAATRAIWEPPKMGIISFVDAGKTRRKRDPGRCYRRAGWTHVGFTQGGLYAFQQMPADMPDALPSERWQEDLFAGLGGGTVVWFNVDDNLHDHPKARKAGLEAMGLWAMCGSFSAGYLLEGFVPKWKVEGYKNGPKLAQKLVMAGLWIPGEHEGESGWFYHQWHERNRTKAQVEADRAKARERQKRHRDAQANAGSHAVTDSVTNGVTNAALAKPSQAKVRRVTSIDG